VGKKGASIITATQNALLPQQLQLQPVEAEYTKGHHQLCHFVERWVVWCWCMFLPLLKMALLSQTPVKRQQQHSLMLLLLMLLLLQLLP